MPSYLNIRESNKFWDAPDSDIFSVTDTAIALGIGRNRMDQIPVNRIMVNRGAYYRKSDILTWALSDDGMVLIKQLSDKKSRIKGFEKVKSSFYDFHYSRSYGSHNRTPIGKTETKQARYDRLCKEWGAYREGYRDSIKFQLKKCHDDSELAKLVEIAWSIREQFVKLRMGLPRGIELGNWWFAENLTEVKRGKIKSRIRSLEHELKHLETYRKPYSISPMFDTGNFDADTEIAAVKDDLMQCRTELDDLG